MEAVHRRFQLPRLSQKSVVLLRWKLLQEEGSSPRPEAASMTRSGTGEATPGTPNTPGPTVEGFRRTTNRYSADCGCVVAQRCCPHGRLELGRQGLAGTRGHRSR